MIEHSDLDAFEQAWSHSSGSDRFDRYRRRSLMALASQNPELAETAARLSGAGRTQLDLHVEDPRSADHEAIALILGHFVTRLAKSVKEITKSNLGRDRWRDELRVLAPALGSVRIVFVEPPNRPTVGGLAYPAHVPTPEAQAMRQLVVLLNLAERDEAPLEAAVYRMRGPARTAVRLMSETISEASWNLSGSLRVAGKEPVPISVTPAGAVRLAKATRETEDEPVHATVYGTVDGWTWSTSTMRFLPEAGRAFEVVVPEELEEAVAHFNAERVRVQVALSGVRVHPTGDAGTARTSFWLDQVESVPDLF